MLQSSHGKPKRGGLPFSEGINSPPYERREGDSMITYPELIQFCMFIVALIGLCYQIFKDRK